MDNSQFPFSFPHLILVDEKKNLAEDVTCSKKK